MKAYNLADKKEYYAQPADEYTKLIKDICGENGECFTCPFSKEGHGCLIDNRMPCEWELIDEEEWKVFK